MKRDGGTRSGWFATSVSGVWVRSAARNKISFNHVRTRVRIHPNGHASSCYLQ
ncbi:Uncharacterised protein [Klebsiella pneumoniae]|nr:Uncharacterised protein [Klebsiella pneumoniae]